MAIIVVCPGCRKSFKVSEKFAGKTGPCPNCKRTLQVPTKEEEVTVHAPEAFAGGGKSASGKLITKPIARANTKFHPVKAAAIAGGAIFAFIAAWLGGSLHLFDSMIGKTVGLLLISPPLVLAAYEMLRDEELEPYRGMPLCLRTGACSLAYAGLWGVFAVLVANGWIGEELWNWLFVVPALAMLGGGAGLASLDLEFGNAVFHYGFYLIATVLLRYTAGLGWVWDL